jgi:hypothetical protein
MVAAGSVADWVAVETAAGWVVEMEADSAAGSEAGLVVDLEEATEGDSAAAGLAAGWEAEVDLGAATPAHRSAALQSCSYM